MEIGGFRQLKWQGSFAQKFRVDVDRSANGTLQLNVTSAGEALSAGMPLELFNHHLPIALDLATKLADCQPTIRLAFPLYVKLSTLWPAANTIWPVRVSYIFRQKFAIIATALETE